MNLCILRTLPVTVATGEQSFSKLIKTLTACQNRLINLAILSIENNVFLETDFQDVTNNFAEIKKRKFYNLCKIIFIESVSEKFYNLYVIFSFTHIK